MKECIAPNPEREYWKNHPLQNTRDVGQFLSFGHHLGEAIEPWMLDAYRPRNLEAVAILESDHKNRWARPTTDSCACIIPAYNEEHIGILLQELSIQFSELLREQTVRWVDIVVSVNGEQELDVTCSAVNSYLSRNPITHPSLKIHVISTEEKGKLAAHKEGIEFLERSEILPEKVLFFDADYMIGKNGISLLMSLLTHDTHASSVSLKYPPVSETLKHAVGVLPLRRRKTDKFLQGGAIGMSSELLPLYWSYTHAFPGTVMNDLNFTLLLLEKGIPYKISDECISTSPVPKSWKQIVAQQKRWIQGIQQSPAFISKEHNTIVDSLFREATKRVGDFFPRFPDFTTEELHLFIRQCVRYEIPAYGYFQTMFLLSALHNQLPNIYKERLWTPPR